MYKSLRLAMLALLSVCPMGLAGQSQGQEIRFIATLADPELLKEAGRSKLGIDPIDGPATAQTMQSLYELKPASVQTIKALLVPHK